MDKKRVRVTSFDDIKTLPWERVRIGHCMGEYRVEKFVVKKHWKFLRNMGVNRIIKINDEKFFVKEVTENFVKPNESYIIIAHVK